MKQLFRNFIIGKNEPLLLSDSEFKKVILRGNLALVGLVVGVSYTFIDHLNGIYGNEPYYIACSAISIATLFLIRAGQYTLSSVLFLSAMALLIFLFSASDSYQTGVYSFFIASSLTSLVLFGYKDRKLALLYSGISLGLFYLAYWTKHSYMPTRTFSEDYVKISFSINFISALVACIAIVYFLIDLNFNSEKQILAKNDQLAKANSELDRFVYSASHDMRAPLSSILGLVQIYQLSGSEEEKNKVVELIRNRAHKLDEFIREILDYSRNSRLEIKLVPVNAISLITEVVENIRYARDFESVKISLAAVENFTVYTDIDRLRVILSNLIGNAIKYHDAYKDIPWIKIRTEKTDSSWSILIEDNGIGIPSEHQEKIFDMFYRAHDHSEGSGLGLYIAREAAIRLKGTISFQSAFGEGTTFRIDLPTHPA